MFIHYIESIIMYIHFSLSANMYEINIYIKKLLLLLNNKNNRVIIIYIDHLFIAFCLYFLG